MFEHRLALLIAAATLGLIVFGGVVHNTESGLSCPDWPLCHGELLPDPGGGVEIEMGHRIAATGVGLLTVLLAITARVRRRFPARYRRWTWIALLLVLIQGAFGALTVILRLPTFASTVHLGISILFLSVLIHLAIRGEAPTRPWPLPGPRPAAGRLVWWLGAAAGLIYLQMLLGALVRHTGSGAAAGLGPGAAFIGIDPATGARSLWPLAWPGRLNMLHRYAAVAVAGFALAVGVRVIRLGDRLRDARLTLFGNALIGLLLLQVGMGILSLKSYLGIGFVTGHLAVGTLLYACALAGFLYLHRLRHPGDDRVHPIMVVRDPGPARRGTAHGRTG